MKADEEILRKKAMYEFKLMEWRDACRVLQEHITKAKYDNQIELARKREELEDDYEAQLNKLTANARQDAHLNIRNIEAATHQENQSLTLKTISQRYKLEKQKREIEMQQELNKKIMRDITINKGMDEQYQIRSQNQAKTIN